jgi:transposase-like protein
MSINFTDPIFSDEAKAREHLERVRWPNGPVCPHCGSENVTRLSGKSGDQGQLHCRACRKRFTVAVGTVYERSHIPLHKWVLALHLMAASKKGVSAHQLHRMLDITYKAAWFMAHRIREAMMDTDAGPIGGEGKTVEADELYIGKRETPIERNRYLPPPTKGRKSGPAGKRVFVALVERGGHTRMFHVHRATIAEVRDVVVRNADRASILYTDESRLYLEMGKEFADHRSVKHSAKEYARREGDIVVHTNTIENVFSVFRRGMQGVYQHCGEAHLFRYLAEFEFRYNRRAKLGFTDTDRALDAIRGAEGKRLTYQQTGQAGHA